MERRFPILPFVMPAIAVAAALLVLAAPAGAQGLADGPVAWSGVTAIAQGRGEKGPWRQNDSRYDYVDDPSVAIDSEGRIFVAWVEQGRKDVLFRRYVSDAAGALQPAGEAINVSRSPDTFSWLPRVVLSRTDPQAVYLIWQEIIFSGASHGGEIFFARSRDGGRSFEAPRNISNLPGGDGKGRINRDIWSNGSFDLAAGADGLLIAAWTEYDGQLWLARSTDGGGTFSTPRQIAGSKARPARAPSLAIGKQASSPVALAWTTGEDPSADIHVASSADGGASFGPAAVAVRSKGYSDAPKLLFDDAGVLHLAYAESAGGPFDRFHIRFARSTDGGRRFETPRELTPANIGKDGSKNGDQGGAGFPALAADAAGRMVVLWERFPDHREQPRGLGMAVSADGGKSFSPPQAVPHSADPAGGWNGSQQGLLMNKLAVSGKGAIVIANSSLEPGRQSRVWLIRGELRP